METFGRNNSEGDMEQYAHDDIDGGTDIGAFALCVVEGGGVFSGVGSWECWGSGCSYLAEEGDDELIASSPISWWWLKGLVSSFLFVAI